MGSNGSQWHGQEQGEQAIDEYCRQVHTHHPPTRRADHLHHADLPHLLGNSGVHHVDDQEPAQSQRQRAQHLEDEQQGIYGLLQPVNLRIGDLMPAHSHAHAFQPILDPLTDLLRPLLEGNGLARNLLRKRLHEHVEPVESLLLVGQPGDGLHGGVEIRIAAPLWGFDLRSAHDALDRQAALTSSELDADHRAQGNTEVL